VTRCGQSPNTIFHGTKVLRTWLSVVFEMCANKNRIAAREVERKYDVTPMTAWFMLHRILEAMRREPLAGMLRGRSSLTRRTSAASPRTANSRASP
jgi:hypothetical protein